MRASKKETLQTVIEAGNVILTARGIEGIEYNCEFLQVTKAPRSPAWLVHRALPGARLSVSLTFCRSSK